MWEAEQEQHTHSTDPKSKARRVSAGKGGLSQAHPAWAGNFLVPTSTCDSEKTQPWSEPETSNCQMRGSLTRVLLPKAAHDSQKEITTPSVTGRRFGHRFISDQTHPRAEDPDGSARTVCPHL